MKKLAMWLVEIRKKHYLLHIFINGAHANVYINQPLGLFLAKQKHTKMVVLAIWPISTSDYLLLKTYNTEHAHQT